MRKDGQLHIRENSELLREAKEAATAMNLTLSDVIHQFLCDFVACNKPKAEEDLGVEQA